MRKLLATTLMTLLSAALVGAAVLGLVTAAGATTSAKPPVKLEGSVTNKGTKSVTGTSTTIEQDDFYFKPTFLKAKAGSTIKVTVKNDGGTQHTFTIDDQNIDKTIAPGKSVKVSVTIPSDGKPVNFYCRFHVASGMQGAFFTKPGAAATSSGSGGSSGGSSGY